MFVLFVFKCILAQLFQLFIEGAYNLLHHTWKQKSLVYITEKSRDRSGTPGVAEFRWPTTSSGISFSLSAHFTFYKLPPQMDLPLMLQRRPLTTSDLQDSRLSWQKVSFLLDSTKFLGKALISLVWVICPLWSNHCGRRLKYDKFQAWSCTCHGI